MRLLRRKDTGAVAYIPIITVIHLEIGTIRHKLALESLLLVEHTQTPKDHQTFTDNGDLTLLTLYDDLCQAYRLEITVEERARLRILDESQLPKQRKRRKR